jgi:hypothetical protein
MSHAQATCPIEDAVDVAQPMATRPRRRVGRPPIEESIELVMPTQFHAPASESWWPGEKRLMLAVLTDAIEVLLKGPGVNGPRRRNLYEETASWFAGEAPEWPFSFFNVCAVLGLDEGAVRSAVGRRIEQARRRIRVRAQEA